MNLKFEDTGGSLLVLVADRLMILWAAISILYISYSGSWAGAILAFSVIGATPHALTVLLWIAFYFLFRYRLGYSAFPFILSVYAISEIFDAIYALIYGINLNQTLYIVGAFYYPLLLALGVKYVRWKITFSKWFFIPVSLYAGYWLSVAFLFGFADSFPMVLFGNLLYLSCVFSFVGRAPDSKAPRYSPLAN